MRLALALVVAVAATAPSALADVGSPAVSANWSGYAITAPAGAAPIAFRDVTGTWVQPRVRCTRGSVTSSAFWVGLGGYDQAATSVQQLGTAADCDANGRATYRAWWELVPAAPVRIPLRIAPGDRVTAAVLVEGRRITMTLKNLTRHTRFAKTLTASRPLDVSSAEWIAEAPSVCASARRCTPVPLTEFGTVVFSRAAAIGNGHAGTIDDPSWQATPIALDSNGGTPLGLAGRVRPLLHGPLYGALPSAVTADGRGFTVAAQVTES